jgi:hypothetical protein
MTASSCSIRVWTHATVHTRALVPNMMRAARCLAPRAEYNDEIVENIFVSEQAQGHAGLSRHRVLAAKSSKVPTGTLKLDYC